MERGRRGDASCGLPERFWLTSLCTALCLKEPLAGRTPMWAIAATVPRHPQLNEVLHSNSRVCVSKRLQITEEY
ncbi:hypothetical protein MATL_G00159370 [Megalops atlanticus]|uniref:Uncharacterized protein n=1 Tax=Megalops atlanticus TaxID=7932 RepID=A0A9D3PUG7_MEGAT|nr:hypothetical protein MATL_G00159370 [Megalops atlanticus]